MMTYCGSLFNNNTGSGSAGGVGGGPEQDEGQSLQLQAPKTQNLFDELKIYRQDSTHNDVTWI